MPLSFWSTTPDRSKLRPRNLKRLPAKAFVLREASEIWSMFVEKVNSRQIIHSRLGNGENDGPSFFFCETFYQSLIFK